MCEQSQERPRACAHTCRTIQNTNVLLATPIRNKVFKCVMKQLSDNANTTPYRYVVGALCVFGRRYYALRTNRKQYVCWRDNRTDVKMPKYRQSKACEFDENNSSDNEMRQHRPSATNTQSFMISILLYFCCTVAGHCQNLSCLSLREEIRSLFVSFFLMISILCHTTIYNDNDKQDKRLTEMK